MHGPGRDIKQLKQVFESRGGMARLTKGGDTRRRILEAAAAEFVKQGYRHARVREICRRAQANVAAVSYHFGGKRRLYEEVLRFAFLHLPKVDPAQMVVTAGAGAEERLSEFVGAFLEQLLSTGRNAIHLKLITRELVDPTRAIDAVVEEGMKPQVALLMQIIRELIGARTNTLHVRRCAGSVLGQCLFYHFARPANRRLGLEPGKGRAGVDSLAAHITEFSLKAITGGQPTTRSAK